MRAAVIFVSPPPAVFPLTPVYCYLCFSRTIHADFAPILGCNELIGLSPVSQNIGEVYAPLSHVSCRSPIRVITGI
jgi:hypothetical protein